MTRIKDASRLCRWMFVVSLFATGVSGATSRTLDGVITHDEKPVSRAVVKVEDPKTLAVRSFITGKDGRYHFAGLGTDRNYVVWAEWGKLKSSEKYCNSFDSDPTPTIDFNLSPPFIRV